MIELRTDLIKDEFEYANAVQFGADWHTNVKVNSQLVDDQTNKLTK